MHGFRIAIFTLAGLMAGCLFDTSDDVAFTATDVRRDSGGQDEDGFRPADGGFDFGQPDLASGPVCPGAPAPTGTPPCSPVTQRRCNFGQFCDVVVTSPGTPPTFEFECRVVRPEHRLGGRTGESCNDNTEELDYAPCRPGNRCVGGTCYRYCRIEDGAGCSETESCLHWFPADQITHVGLCVEDCSEFGAR